MLLLVPYACSMTESPAADEPNNEEEAGGSGARDETPRRLKLNVRRNKVQNRVYSWLRSRCHLVRIALFPGRYPRFDEDRLKYLQGKLDSDYPLNVENYSWVKKFKKSARKFWVRWAVSVASMLVATFSLFDVFYFGIIRIESRAELSLSIALIAGAVANFWIFYFSPRRRFFRRAGKAEFMAVRNFSAHDDFARCMNFAGLAARMLFRELQRHRRAWISPPMVTSSALTCATQLIDVDLESPDERSKRELLSRYSRFIRDVSYLVAIQREDLIQKLRDQDVDLKHRDPVGGLLLEVDLRYIDPAYNMNRWEVRERFYYPFAAWISAIAATAALIVSLLRP